VHDERLRAEPRLDEVPQAVLRVPGPRGNDAEAGGLVDDDERVVLVDDGEREGDQSSV
jgi:hypothetical protein